MNKTIFTYVLLLMLASCNMSSKHPNHHVKVYKSPNSNSVSYKYELPDTTLHLNTALIEISGLTFDQSANKLLAINDEKGNVYKLDLSTGDIIEKDKFHSSGDYEGIEKVDRDVYILKSNGNIYHFINQETNKIETPLSETNDVEGLGFDKSNNQLLLACKAKTLEDNYPKGTKAIYAYQLHNNEFINSPFLLIKRSNIEDILEFNNVDEKIIKRSKSFSPSGIAIHPQTQQIYVTSARESMMLVYSKEHKLIQCIFFDKGKIPQPEGICFSPDGTLYLSTEGQGNKGKIFIYHPTNLN